MTRTASPSLAGHFALIIEGMCQIIARRVGLGLAGPLIILIRARLRRYAARFAHATTTPYRPSKPRPNRLRPSRPHPLPRRKAWLLRLVPETASGASQLRHFLADPELAALLAADPRFNRILRPLCRMLGIRAASLHPAKAAPPPDAPPAEAPPAPIPCLAPGQPAPVSFPPWATPPALA
ncbi:MAG TPA: hypothetical protein VFN77_05115 [Acetobacteraceae bacterium]|nr:hypothetical protein [Acetobacteraceae bacterium]